MRLLLALVMVVGGCKSKLNEASPAPPAPAASPYPTDEQAFCSAINGARAAYQSERRSGANNEIRLANIREGRGRLIRAAVPTLEVHGWVARVERIGTSSVDDAASISLVIPPCKASIKTWNNAVSDARTGTMIKKSSPLYRQLGTLTSDSFVIFSGAFIPDDKDGITEMSVSEGGDMRAPEFLMRFSEIVER